MCIRDSSVGDDDYESLSSMISSPCNMMKEHDIVDDDNDNDNVYSDDYYFEDTDGGSYNDYDYDDVDHFDMDGDIFIEANNNVIDDGMDDQSQVIESSRVDERSYYFSTPLPFILYSFLTNGFNAKTNSINDATSSIITISDITSDATSIAADTTDTTATTTIDSPKDNEVHSKGYLLDQ